ncbi:MAG: 50S ribosomal protein L18e [Candidatus Pacearchaeota archaeon]
MKSKTRIEKQTKRKTNPNLVETIRNARKNKKWLEVAGLLSNSRKKRAEINLDRINKEAKEGDIVVVPGKVLSQGELTKKIKIIAFGFSENAREKILKSKSELNYIYDEIKKNPEAKGVKILK